MHLQIAVLSCRLSRCPPHHPNRHRQRSHLFRGTRPQNPPPAATPRGHPHKFFRSAHFLIRPTRRTPCMRDHFASDSPALFPITTAPYLSVKTCTAPQGHQNAHKFSLPRQRANGALSHCRRHHTAKAATHRFQMKFPAPAEKAGH